MAEDYSRAMSLASDLRELIGLPSDHPMSDYHYLNVRKVMEYNGIAYFVYSQLSHLGSMQELIELYGPDGAAVIKGKNKFIIVNDIKRKEHSSCYRPLWTIIHELGHFLLGHLEGDDCIRLTTEKYDWYEKETNHFTANVLLSEDAVYKYITKNHIDKSFLDCNDLGHMHEYFCVSWEALINRLDFLGIQSVVLSNFLVSTYQERKAVAASKGIALDSIYMSVYMQKLWEESGLSVYEDFAANF